MPTEDTEITRPAGDLIAYVLRVMACDGCGCEYSAEDVQVVYHRDAQWELTATCPRCRATRVVTAYDRPPYHQLRNGADVVPSRVTRDEVTAWTAYLAEFTGDVFDLLAQS